MRQGGGSLGVNMGFDHDNFGSNAFGIGTRHGSTDTHTTFIIDLNGGNDPLIGMGIKDPTAKLHIKSPSLGGTAGDQQRHLTLHCETGNSDQLRFETRRSTTGSGWDYAAQRIQRTVDVTPMGYIEFGNHSSAQSSHPIIIGDSTGDETTDNVADVPRIVVDVDGNVGIGNIDPTTKLEVDGNVKASGITVTGNVTSATPTANTHLTTKDYVDSQLGGVAGNTVIVKKVTGAQMAALTTSSSTWIELIPAPGAGNFIAVREFECYIDRGGSAASGVAAWKPTVSGQIRGFGDDVQLAFRNTSSQSNYQYNTFGVLQKGILNHLINNVFNTSAANTDIILVRDAPVTQTRAYPNVPLLLKPKSSSTTSNFTTYSGTSTHTLNDDYYLRISYRVMSLSSHFQVT